MKCFFFWWFICTMKVSAEKTVLIFFCSDSRNYIIYVPSYLHEPPNMPKKVFHFLLRTISKLLSTFLVPFLHWKWKISCLKFNPIIIMTIPYFQRYSWQPFRAQKYPDVNHSPSYLKLIWCPRITGLVDIRT